MCYVGPWSSLLEVGHDLLQPSAHDIESLPLPKSTYEQSHPEHFRKTLLMPRTRRCI